MIKKLIIIAGPSCSGKTNFAKRLRAGECPELVQKLSLEDPEKWQFADVFFMDATAVREVQSRVGETLLAHWTIPHPSLKLLVRQIFTRNAHDRAHRIDLIRSAQSVICLTLHASPDTLCSRIDLRENRVRQIHEDGRDSRWKYRRKIRHLDALRRTYRSVKSTDKMYQRWFRFMNDVGADEHYLVDYNNEPLLQPLGQWDTILADH